MIYYLNGGEMKKGKTDLAGLMGAFVSIGIAVFVGVGVLLPVMQELQANTSQYQESQFDPNEYDLVQVQPEPNFKTLIEESKPIDINMSHKDLLKSDLDTSSLSMGDLLS